MKKILILILSLFSLTAAAQTSSTDKQLAKLRKRAATEVYKAFKEYTLAKQKLDSRIESARRLGMTIRLTADTLRLDTLLVSSDTTEIVKRFEDTTIDPMPAPVFEPPVFTSPEVKTPTPAKNVKQSKPVSKPTEEKPVQEVSEEETKAPLPEDLAAEASDYYLGDGRPQDYYKAFSLYQQAADGGSPEGYFGLAVCYLEGHGTDKNYPAAVKWLTKAADNGDTDAMYLLGQCYERGRGVSENIKKAVTLYRQAASKGNINAAEYLKKIGY